jgi:hypothetical protein
MHATLGEFSLFHPYRSFRQDGGNNALTFFFFLSFFFLFLSFSFSLLSLLSLLSLSLSLSLLFLFLSSVPFDFDSFVQDFNNYPSNCQPLCSTGQMPDGSGA